MFKIINKSPNQQRLHPAQRLNEGTNKSPGLGPNGECWLWSNHLTNGYGQISINGKQIRVHRLAYELTHGVIPNGMVICHVCDTPSCVNPAHLFLGDQKANMLDMARKGRGRGQGTTHCNKAHEFTPDNTILTKRGPLEKGRKCKTCYQALCARKNGTAKIRRALKSEGSATND